MIDKQKEYFIRLFLKITKLEEEIESSISFFILMISKSYNLSENIIKDVKDKFTKEEYIKKIIPVIDNQFSIEEIKTIINFYGSSVGRKILDKNYTQIMKSVGDDFMAKIQDEMISLK